MLAQILDGVPRQNHGCADSLHRLADLPADVAAAGDALYKIRHVAVHEGDTRVEQPDATQAIRAMRGVLAYLVDDGS